MLSISATSTAVGSSSFRRRLGSIPSRGDAWRRRTPASMDLKRQQLLTQQQSDAMSIDDQQPEETSTESIDEPPEPPKRRVFTAFRLMMFKDSDDEAESDYAPSGEEEGSEGEEEDEEEGVSAEEHKQEETSESEEEEQDPDNDSRWWKSCEDKRRWEKRYREADAAFRKRFGCGIDTPSHPETRRRIRKEKKRHRPYTYVLAGLVVAYLVQLAVVYSASSWAFSMVAWRQPSTIENSSSNGDDSTSISGKAVLKPTTLSSQQQVPEHVRTGLHLCATLSRRVVKSEHDVTSTQHALRACDIAAKFAPLKSREAIEAHVLRGDLLSLLSRFDSADEDYRAAMVLVVDVDSTILNPTLAGELSHGLDLKIVANRWTKLYKTKSFKELRREAKARVVNAVEQDADTNAVSKLAADWLSAFKRKKPVLEVLTTQRSWTLRHLKYEALIDDTKAQSDVVT